MVELSKQQFCKRFVARIVEAGGESNRVYGQEVAPMYWADTAQRAEGPEVCADNDISQWSPTQ